MCYGWMKTSMHSCSCIDSTGSNQIMPIRESYIFVFRKYAHIELVAKSEQRTLIWSFTMETNEHSTTDTKLCVIKFRSDTITYNEAE